MDFGSISLGDFRHLRFRWRLFHSLLLNLFLTMYLGFAIGHLGNDAEKKSANGREFITFRIAHTDRWTDQAGATHENTQWIDCVMNGDTPVFPYLKKGTQVCVIGTQTIRVYSSAKDRCMKAGTTINVQRIELLSGRTDDVPSRIYDGNGVEHTVTKWYFAADYVRDNKQPEVLEAIDRSGRRYHVDRGGLVRPIVEQSGGDNHEG